MTDTLSPYDVAQHWPFLERHLFRLPPAQRRALELVAVGQVAVDGEAVPVRARALAQGFTAGEAGRVGMVLADLERRGALWCYRGRGRRPHLWSLRPELGKWRGFEWGAAIDSVAEAIGGCFCRATFDFVARSPGQGLVELRRRAQFDLLPRDHVRPPGLLLVETRDKAKDRATKSGRPGLFPVETRDKSPDVEAPSIPPEEQLFLNGENERFEMLKKACEAVTGQDLFPRSAPAKRLAALAQRLNHAQCALVAAALRREPGNLYFPKVVDVAADLAVEPAVKAAGRSEGYQDDGPRAAAL